MFIITTKSTRADIDQAVRLARANYVELIHKYVKPHGPTSNLCITQVKTEVEAYLTMLAQVTPTYAPVLFLPRMRQLVRLSGSPSILVALFLPPIVA